MNDFTQAITSALSLIVRLDPELSGIVALSLRVSLTASLIALVIGAPFGAYLAVSRFRGRQGVIVLTNAFLGLPPVVAGLGVYPAAVALRPARLGGPAVHADAR